MNKKEIKFFYAYDPIIRRRVPHALIQGYLVSMVTGNKLKYKDERKNT